MGRLWLLQADYETPYTLMRALFWIAMGPTLEIIGDEAWCEWANTLPAEALGRDW